MRLKDDECYYNIYWLCGTHYSPLTGHFMRVLSSENNYYRSDVEIDEDGTNYQTWNML